MNCEGIHCTDCTDLSYPSYFILFSFPPSGIFALALVTSPLLNLVALSLPLSTRPHSWHETSISTPWNMERALMNCLQVSSMHANGSRGTGSGFQAGCSGRRAVIAGRTGLPKDACKPAGSDYSVMQTITRASSCTVYVCYIKCSYFQVC